MGQQFRYKVGGKFSYAEMPDNIKTQVRSRLAGKDPIIMRGEKGELPGLKIDGIQVTRYNIHQFEKKAKVEKPKAEKPKAAEPEEPIVTVGIQPATEIDFEGLLSVKGIGAKTVDTLKESYKTEEELAEALKDNKVPLKESIIKILKKVILGAE